MDSGGDLSREKKMMGETKNKLGLCLEHGERKGGENNEFSSSLCLVPNFGKKDEKN